MITIFRNEQKLQVNINADVNNKEFILTWNCNDDVYAELLAIRMNEVMRNKLKAIREEAYNEGWKHAKAKRAKQTWFRGIW